MSNLGEGRRALGSLSYKSKLVEYSPEALKIYEDGGDYCEVCSRTNDQLLRVGEKVVSLIHNPLDGPYFEEESVRYLCQKCAEETYRDRRQANDVESVTKGMRYVLQSLGLDLEDENYCGTPGRVSAFLLGHFQQYSRIADTLARYAVSSFPSEYYGIISQSGISADGLCPHHFLPVIYDIDVAYIPDGRAVGLSKLSRVVKTVANFPLLQEDLTEEIRLQISRMVKTDHVSVVVRGRHTCMSVRGVHSQSPTVTSSMTGDFYDDPSTRSEVLSLFQQGRMVVSH